MSRHYSRSTTPVERHAAPRNPIPDRGDVPGNSDFFCSPGIDQVADQELTKQEHKARRNTSGTVLVTNTDDTSDGSTSGTESSDAASNRPVADDGCPHAFARMKEFEEKARQEKEKLYRTMQDKVSEDIGSTKG